MGNPHRSSPFNWLRLSRSYTTVSSYSHPLFLPPPLLRAPGLRNGLTASPAPPYWSEGLPGSPYFSVMNKALVLPTASWHLFPQGPELIQRHLTDQDTERYGG